ncbi:MAG: hypothetical protein ACD_55C00169G0008 [uncultured bacterium]|uniref:Uncharacterized protein n=1 Tax=Citrifermentans bemidjiense (strain ATCC BAA-1014 / DSM 16622 / JCM 12645 / Bem) TaxID=404380 RepID=B5E9S2_CITBB|nr:hypothetical protein [Citrifermentans bemidjiense]ACH40246.1 hypothetical protein Gbem_3249 [Citrifermentans bemidjiense Bem]EKD59086.1 MAG: hypothetical protein ACD_55C00169G0008 [uncultured bacterium]
MAHDKVKKGGAAPRQRKFLCAYGESSTFNISEACKAAGIGRRTFYNWLTDDSKFKTDFEELTESRLDAIESALHSRAVIEKDTTALIFLAKTLLKDRGYIEGRGAIGENAPIVREVIDEVIAGSCTVEMAALRIAREGKPLPKVLEIMLTKPDLGNHEEESPPISDEELEEKYQAALRQVAEQRDKFVPQRREEVVALKEVLRDQDSFKPGGE